MEVQPTDRPSPGHSNEPKAIAHIRVASGIRTRVRRIGFLVPELIKFVSLLVIFEHNYDMSKHEVKND